MVKKFGEQTVSAARPVGRAQITNTLRLWNATLLTFAKKARKVKGEFTTTYNVCECPSLR